METHRHPTKTENTGGITGGTDHGGAGRTREKGGDPEGRKQEEKTGNSHIANSRLEPSARFPCSSLFICLTQTFILLLVFNLPVSVPPPPPSSRHLSDFETTMRERREGWRERERGN